MRVPKSRYDDPHDLEKTLKSNVDYHLIPAQTIIIKDGETKRVEETNYMLPQAIAIHVKHLREILNDIGHPSS